jgi:chitodextrinase
MQEHNVSPKLQSPLDQAPPAPYDFKIASLTDTVGTFNYKQPISDVPIRRWEMERSVDNFETSPWRSLLTDSDRFFNIPFTERKRVWANMKPDTAYAYRVRARGINNRTSAWSAIIHGHTLGEGGVPSTPRNVRVQARSEHSLSIAWDASVAASQVAEYIIYRDGVVVRRLPGRLSILHDRDLLANTSFEYVIVARDRDNKISRASTPLRAQTQDNGRPTTWQVNQWYEVGQIVIHDGHLWTCLQSHRSYDEKWAPGLPGSDVLWVRVD